MQWACHERCKFVRFPSGRIEVLAIAFVLAAAGCGNPAPASSPPPPETSSALPDGQQVYSTIEELRQAYDQVGQCSKPSDVEATVLSCEDQMILGIATSESDRDAEVAAMNVYTEKLGYHILVGKNWIIAGKDIEPARQKLGGIVAG